MHASRRAALAAAALTTGILLATLWPLDDVSANRGFRWCLVCGGETVDALINVLGFVPLGIALSRAGLSAWQSALFGLLLSAGVEATQGSLIPGRHGELRDVVTNTVGAGLGAWASAWIAALWRPTSSARLLAAVSALGFVAVTAGTAWLLQPHWPHQALHGQWAPDRSPYPRFTGRVEAVEFEGMEIPEDRLSQEAPLRTAVAGGRLHGRVRIATGPPPAAGAEPALIAVLVAGRRDVARFTQVGSHATFGVRLRSERYGLRTLTLVLPAVLDTEGRTIELEGRLTPEALSIAASGETARTGWTLPRTAALGWAIVSPVRTAIGPWHPIASAIWLVCLAFPMGFYPPFVSGGPGTRGRRTAAFSAVAGLSLAAGLFVVPAVAALAPAPPVHWLSALAGVAAGAAVGTWRSRRERRRHVAATPANRPERPGPGGSGFGVAPDRRSLD